MSASVSFNPQVAPVSYILQVAPVQTRQFGFLNMNTRSMGPIRIVLGQGDAATLV